MSDPTRRSGDDSVPLLLARARNAPLGPEPPPRGTRGEGSQATEAEEARPHSAIGYLRARLGAVGALVAVLLVLCAIFADMLASDLPIACKIHGHVRLFPNVTRDATLATMGTEAIARQADWAIWPLVAHGPLTPTRIVTSPPSSGEVEQVGQDVRGTTSAASPSMSRVLVLAAPGRVPGHPFGTDREGRDVFARVVHGARTYLVFALLAVAASLAFGGLFGALAGLFGGATDALVGRAIETVSAFPPLVLVLGIQAAVPHPTVFTLFLGIALTRWPEVARLVRAEVMQVSTRDYIFAARALGASPLRILGRHIAPNVRGQLVVLGAVGIPAVILIEASLDFLRVGGPAYAASWGETMSEFRDAPGAWWLLAFPGAFLFATVIALNLVGEARRDALDPRAR